MPEDTIDPNAAILIQALRILVDPIYAHGSRNEIRAAAWGLMQADDPAHQAIGELAKRACDCLDAINALDTRADP